MTLTIYVNELSDSDSDFHMLEEEKEMEKRDYCNEEVRNMAPDLSYLYDNTDFCSSNHSLLSVFQCKCWKCVVTRFGPDCQRKFTSLYIAPWILISEHIHEY